MKQSLILLVGMTVFMYGCESTYEAQIDSQPEGASIYWGSSPLKLQDSGYKTPFVAARFDGKTRQARQAGQDFHYVQEFSCTTGGLEYSGVYFKLKKNGYKDSDVMFIEPEDSNTEQLWVYINKPKNKKFSIRLLPDPEYQTVEERAKYWNSAKPFTKIEKGFFYFDLKETAQYYDVPDSELDILGFYVFSSYKSTLERGRLEDRLLYYFYLALDDKQTIGVYFSNTLRTEIPDYSEYDTTKGLFAGKHPSIDAVYGTNFNLSVTKDMAEKFGRKATVRVFFTIEDDSSPKVEYSGDSSESGTYIPGCSISGGYVGDTYVPSSYISGSYISEGGECSTLNLYKAKLHGLKFMFVSEVPHTIIAIFNK